MALQQRCAGMCDDDDGAGDEGAVVVRTEKKEMRVGAGNSLKQGGTLSQDGAVRCGWTSWSLGHPLCSLPPSLSLSLPHPRNCGEQWLFPHAALPRCLASCSLVSARPFALGCQLCSACASCKAVLLVLVLVLPCGASGRETNRARRNVWEKGHKALGLGGASELAGGRTGSGLARVPISGQHAVEEGEGTGAGAGRGPAAAPSKQEAARAGWLTHSTRLHSNTLPWRVWRASSHHRAGPPTRLPLPPHLLAICLVTSSCTLPRSPNAAGQSRTNGGTCQSGGSAQE